MPVTSIFNITSKKEFEQKALETFRHQSVNCNVYKQFVGYLGVNPRSVNKVRDIPFLPIQFFKSLKIVSNQDSVQQIFLSSGTGGTQSKHYVTDLSIYEKSYLKGFSHFYGNIENYTVLALLPSYLERQGSSLIYMADDLIKKSGSKFSGFFLDDYDAFINAVKKSKEENRKLLVLGVSFALLDLAEQYNIDLSNAIVMETGGMKGRRKELIRDELHKNLCQGLNANLIHSEYGMTELLSQAYSIGNGVFECPPWMDVLIRDTEDALSFLPNGKSGGVNVIDLANINSCSFIATQDLGKKFDNGTFEILGRFDNSDIRGCNLLIG